MTATGHPQCRCSMVTYSDEDYNEMKEDSAYLDDVVNTIKLNYNCPDSEKIGSEPGSCGGNKPNKKHEPEKPTNIATTKNKKIASFISNALQEDPRRMFHGYIPKKGKLLTTNDTGFWLDSEGKSYVHKKLVDIPEDKRNDLINVHSHAGQDREQLIANKKDVADFKGIESFSGGDFQMLQFNIKNGYGRKIAVIVAPDEYDYFEVPEKKLGEFIKIKDIANKFEAHSSSLEESRKFLMEISNKNGFIYIPAIKFEQKQDSAYLADAFETIKLNYNCPDSEKQGTGPGSCGGNTDSKINLNPEIAPADYNSFFENFNKISKDKSEPDRVMRRLNAETVQRRFYRKTEEHFNEIKPENDKKLKENGEKLWDNLRPEVQSAIKSYTTQDYGVINSALQDDIIREEVSLLKEATSKPLGVSTILYRGINFKMPKDIFKVGATWIHKPFASCSTGSFIAEEAASGKLTHITPEEKTILQIFTEPETKGFAVGKNSFHAGADAGSEVILDAGTKFQTIHSEKRGGMRILTVRAINDEQKQDSSYLEDVTNFIKLNYNCPDSEKIGSGPGSCGGSKKKKKKEILEGQENKQEATLTNLPLGKPDFSGVSIQISKDVGLTNEKYRQELGDNVVGALDAYRRTDYIGINSYLRNGNTKGQDINSIKDQIKLLDSAFIKKTSEPITTFRVLRGQDIINKYQPGSKIDEKAYVSTTISGGVGFFGADSENAISLQIEVPKGTPFVDMSKATTGVENELLLPRNGKLLVKEVRDVTKKLYNLDENGNMVPKDVTRKYARVEYIPENDNNVNSSFQEISSTFNSELGGFHITEYKAPDAKPLRIMSQDKADNAKLLEAIQDLPPETLPAQFTVMKMPNNVPAKYYAKLDTIGVSKKLSSAEMTKAIKDVMTTIKRNERLNEVALLQDAYNTIKLNYRCEENPPGSGNFKCDITKQSDKQEFDKQIQNSEYLEDVTNFIKFNYKCKAGTVDETNACKPTAEQTNELKNLRLDVNPKNKEHKKPRSTTPDRFFEINLSTNINQELSSSITSVIKNAYKNIPELNGVPLKVVNVNEKENRDLENAYAAHDMNKIYLNDKYFSDINEMQEKLTKEVESGFHPKGCNTAESIITHELGHLLFNGMALRGDEKWDKISEVIQEAKDSGELAKVSRYALSEAGNGELSEAASEIFASIFHTKEEDKEPVVKKVRDILFDGNMKTNERYLYEVTDFIKLNYKCPKGTVDDTNACGLENHENKPTNETFIGFKPDHNYSSDQHTEIDKKVRNSLDKAAKPLKNFSTEDKKVLNAYSRNDYININNYLNGNLKATYDLPDDSPVLKEQMIKVEQMDKLFVGSELTEPLTTYRGINDNIMTSNPDLRDALDSPGSEIEFPCFISTSALPYKANNFAEGYNGRLVELQLPKNTKALFIAQESDLPGEMEVLINRGTKFEVVETKYTDITYPISPITKTVTPNKRVKITTIKAIV